MTLNDLGYDEFFESCRKEQGLEQFDTGRVVQEHKERYVIKTTEGEYDAELIGSLRYSAENRSDFPAIGDWVAASLYDENKALIHGIFTRRSVLQRKSVGTSGESQVVAANVDYALIVQAVDRDFNLNRIERYLTICHSSKIQPVILLSKTDLLEPEKLAALISQTAERIRNVPLLPVSNVTGAGHAPLNDMIRKGATYCLLGSSGVGKSTLINTISGSVIQETGSISDSTGKGRHVTTHRELVVLPNGGLVIDNPGIREVGIADLGEGVEGAFENLLAYAYKCRFKDCTHKQEKGCAVIGAVEEGLLDESVFANYHKIERERAHFESSVNDKKKRDKKIGKLYKRIQNERRENKY